MSAPGPKAGILIGAGELVPAFEFLAEVLRFYREPVERLDCSLPINQPQSYGIRHVLHATGLSVQELAKAIGAKPASVYAVYNSNEKNFAGSTARRMRSFCLERGLFRLAEYWDMQAFEADRKVTDKGGHR